jgi:hypothetical protein
MQGGPTPLPPSKGGGGAAGKKKKAKAKAAEVKAAKTHTVSKTHTTKTKTNLDADVAKEAKNAKRKRGRGPGTANPGDEEIAVGGEKHRDGGGGDGETGGPGAGAHPASSGRKRAKKNNWPPEAKRGVIYLGHIPHGFYEVQMRDFFSQFGEVTRLRLARCMKTTKSKGYAFIEFSDVATAKVVAESMNNYLLFEKLLECKHVPHDRVHAETFKNQGKPIKRIRFDQNEMRHRNKRDPKKEGKIVGKLLVKEKDARARLKELGIDYDFPGYSADLPEGRKGAAPASTSNPKKSPAPPKKSPAPSKKSQAPPKKSPAPSKKSPAPRKAAKKKNRKA